MEEEREGRVRRRRNARVRLVGYPTQSDQTNCECGESGPEEWEAMQNAARTARRGIEREADRQAGWPAGWLTWRAVGAKDTLARTQVPTHSCASCVFWNLVVICERCSLRETPNVNDLVGFMDDSSWSKIGASLYEFRGCEGRG